jgi:nucleolar protein 56
MMELVAWFGRVDPESASIIAAGNMEQMVEKLTGLSPLPEIAQPDLRALAKACHYVEDDSEYNRLLREVALELVRRELRNLATVEQDVLHMIEALDDMDKSINLLEERLYEWSLLHRDDLARTKDLPLSLTGHGPIGELATTILDLRRSRQKIEEDLGMSITTIAPNLSELAGPLLAARLMSRAGSLQRLSELPSSTIQIMGAEKSLYKHLKGKAPSPKHGLIYRHPAILNAPKRLRGRLSRALSGKLAIAARIDYHSGVVAPELKNSLEERLSEIRRTGQKKQSERNR